MSDSLLPLGWSDRWAALLAEHGPEAEPGRVLRHDGVAVQVRTPAGRPQREAAPGRGGRHGRRLAGPRRRAGARPPRPRVAAAAAGRRRRGPRSSSPPTSTSCCSCAVSTGPSRPGRIQRGEALAWDAGAHPAPRAHQGRPGRRPRRPRSRGSTTEHPGLERFVDVLGRRARASTSCGAAWRAPPSVLLGESGAGKSRLVNAVLGTDAAVVGAVRAGRRQGSPHHHQPPAPPARRRGGVLIDSPGIREVGLAGDEESVDATFADVEELWRRVPLHRLHPRRRARAAPSPWRWRPATSRPGPARRLPRPARGGGVGRRGGPTSTSAAPTSASSRKAVKAHVKNKPNNQP